MKQLKYLLQMLCNLLQICKPGSKMAECENQLKVPWNKPVKRLSFNPIYKTEFRRSQIKNAELGWWTIIVSLLKKIQLFICQVNNSIKKSRS